MLLITILSTKDIHIYFNSKHGAKKSYVHVAQTSFRTKSEMFFHSNFKRNLSVAIDATIYVYAFSLERFQKIKVLKHKFERKKKHTSK